MSIGFNKIKIFFFVSLVTLYVLNLKIDIMDVDAAQYADIAREMSVTNSYLQVQMKQTDYLDKPPLLFWLSSLSFKIFGTNNIAYKLPALLVLILGIFSVYKMARLWHSKHIAYLSAVILATTQGYFLMTNDVRTDGLLTGFCVFALWQLSVFIKQRTWASLTLAAIGIGLAMLSKGPLGLMIVGFGLATHLVVLKQWKKIFDWRWLVALIVVALVLLPMSIGLYEQFDLHPEKTAYGIESPSGLRFFYWTQSFGRITGESSWSNGAPFFFFFQSILWDFMPWTLFLVCGLIFFLVTSITKKQKEYISIGAFLFPFLILSLSNYKLPHYIFPLFPYASILSAMFLNEMFSKQSRMYSFHKLFSKIQYVLIVLFVILTGLGLVLFFPNNTPFIIWTIFIAFLFAIVLTLRLKISKLDKLTYSTLFVQLLVGFFMSIVLYPNILKYQSPSFVGRWAKDNQLDNTEFFHYANFHHSLDFYSGLNIQELDTSKYKAYKKPIYVFTDERGLKEITKSIPASRVQIEKTFLHHKATELSADFLFHTSRYKTLDTSYIVLLK